MQKACLYPQESGLGLDTEQELAAVAVVGQRKGKKGQARRAGNQQQRINLAVFHLHI